MMTDLPIEEGVLDVSFFKNGMNPKNPLTKSFTTIFEETRNGKHRGKVEKVRGLKKSLAQPALAERDGGNPR